MVLSGEERCGRNRVIKLLEPPRFIYSSMKHDRVTRSIDICPSGYNSTRIVAAELCIPSFEERKVAKRIFTERTNTVFATLRRMERSMDGAFRG